MYQCMDWRVCDIRTGINTALGLSLAVIQSSCRIYSTLLLLLCWCFTAFRHFSGHFACVQVTVPRCSWAGLLGSLPVHIPSPVTDICPSWISGRERMPVEIISWPISTKQCCQSWGSNPRTSAYQADADPTELPRPVYSILLTQSGIHTSELAEVW